MRIFKVINNNLVVSYNDRHKEVLVSGCGLGFGKKQGDEIDPQAINKIYQIEDPNVYKNLADLLSHIPEQHIRVANLIIDYAKKSMDKPLSENVYISITDHISYALERAQKGIPLKNSFLWDVKKFYHSEYLVGMESLAIVKRELGIELPEDEAGYIAIHLIEATMDDNSAGAVNETVKMIESVLSIIRYHYQINIDENSLAYERFMVHLKFFIQRIRERQPITDDIQLYEILLHQYPNEFRCAEKIRQYFLTEHDVDIKKSEMMYLAVHIHRIIEN